MESATQFGFGLRLASDLPVPGALCSESGDSAELIRIALSKSGATEAEFGFFRDDEAIVYRHPCGLFRSTESRIEIEPDEQASLQDLGELLVANALPALLWQKGTFVLHAACLRLPTGPVVAIAGQSGSGKSRLAASLVAAGAELIGDDSLALTATDHGIVARGLPGGWFARSPDSAEREFIRAPIGPARGLAVLDLLVILDAESPAAAGLSPMAALEQLLQHRHRPQVPVLLGRQAAVLAQAATIAQRLPAAQVKAQDLIAAGPLSARAVLADLARPSSCVRFRTH